MISQVACPDPSVDTIHGIPADFSFSLLFSVFLLAAWLATVAESVPHLLMGFSFVLLSAYFFLESLSRQPLYVCVRLCVCVCRFLFLYLSLSFKPFIPWIWHLVGVLFNKNTNSIVLPLMLRHHRVGLTHSKTKLTYAQRYPISCLIKIPKDARFSGINGWAHQNLRF